MTFLLPSDMQSGVYIQVNASMPLSMHTDYQQHQKMAKFEVKTVIHNPISALRLSCSILNPPRSTSSHAIKCRSQVVLRAWSGGPMV
jgi:hypothetical protein